MIWHVYRENINTKRIEIYNIFEHASFRKDIEEAYATCKTKDEFVEQLRKSLMYYFWSKCEWEVIITDWPTHISLREVDRLQDEKNEYYEKWGHLPHSLGVNLPVAEKIDVYDQVRLNWSAFVDYTWYTLKAKALAEILKESLECEEE
jgi:hypothetical protein